MRRYQKLYNSLTFCEFYNDDPKKRVQINKDVFSPHNVKTVLVGAEGAIIYYYVTYQEGKLNPKRSYSVVNFNGCNSVGNNMKPNSKGIMDVFLGNGTLSFNGIEEIVFFTGGWNNEVEFNFEVNKLDTFMRNIPTSMNRLCRVALIDRSIFEFHQVISQNQRSGQSVISTKGSVVNQMKKLGFECYSINSLNTPNGQIEVKYNAKVDSIGLLPRPRFDSSNYKLDAEYDESKNNGKVTVECRLSHYFYAMEKRAKEEAKKADEIEKKNVEEENKKKANAKLEYAICLDKLGYKNISNKTKMFGNDGYFDKVLNWLRLFCTERPDPSTGYKYKTCYYNEDLLRSKRVTNVKDANIWSPDIFTKDEDLTFRLFVKENELSYDILIKLPLDLDEFSFSGPKVDNIAAIFSNRSREKGEIFQSAILNPPIKKSIQGMTGISCAYNAIQVILAKDLLKFRNSNWLFMDYLKACKGEATVFSNFKKLPLGDRIVVGVKPDALKIEKFDCSGQHQTSGIICGQAGSGKSALMDNLVLQFLALKGNFGNGAVVLMDAKQEWPPLWKAVFDAKGIPFYGFDGGIIEKQDEIKQEVIRRGNPTQIGFSQPITQEVGGMVLMRTLYDVIQGILKSAGTKDIESFNKNNKNIDGITRLPRIAIFIDEMNTFDKMAVKGSVAKGIIGYITGAANLTRTAGYMWFLCGQDVPASIIQKKDKGSFKYNIMGTMDKDRYEYFGVDENPKVIEYEELNGTSDNPHPIMKQGTFYAGQKGNTELIRSLYLPDDEKTEALEMLQSDFAGMYELDALVKYALRHNLFDKYHYGTEGKNNIIYAVLRDIGIISDAEFYDATNRLFGTDGSETAADTELDFGEVTSRDDNFETDSSSSLNSPQSQSTLKRPPRPQRPQIQQPISMSYDNDTVTQQFKQDNIVPTNQSRHNKGMTNALMNMDNNSDEFKKVLQSAQSPEVYNGKITIPDNPFKKYNISTNSGAFLSVKECSDIIMREIEKEISPANIVKRFQVHKDGTIAIDGIKFKPEFDAQFLTSLPMSIRNDVYHGQLIELFDLRNVYRFKNLEEFIIEPMNIAQGRARKEMGIGFRKKWNVLFDKMKSLQVIKVGDIPYYRYNPDEDGERSFLDLFKNDPSSTYSHNSGSLLEKVWDSKPCRLFTGTFGWGIGIQATVLLATMMGPFGLLAGGIAAYNTMKAMRNNDANSSNRVYTKKNTTQSKTNKKTVKRD